MVIQDMPALSTSSVFINNETPKQCPAVSTAPSLDPDTVQKEFNRQLGVMVNQLKSYPSIVTWVGHIMSVSTPHSTYNIRSSTTKAGASPGSKTTASATLASTAFSPTTSATLTPRGSSTA